MVTYRRQNRLSTLVVDTHLNMGAHNITLDATQTVDGRDINEALPIPLTVAAFLAFTPTGDCTDPVNATNGDTAQAAYSGTTDQYIEIDFTTKRKIQEYRICAEASDHSGDGTFKLTYWNGASWIDFVTGISTVTAASPYDFGAWTSLGKLIETTKIRIIFTAIDTRGASADRSYMREIEMRYLE